MITYGPLKTKLNKPKEKIKVEKEVNRLFKYYEFGMFPRPPVSKWQYFYESSKGRIGCVYFMNHFGDGINFWEIYCLKGKLFKDAERFKNKKLALQRITQLLQ